MLGGGAAFIFLAIAPASPPPVVRRCSGRRSPYLEPMATILSMHPASYPPAQRPLDLISIGECLVEFSAREDGAFVPAYAGDAFNTLFYASRLGLATGFISALGDDLFTPMILAGIEREGIDRSYLPTIGGRRNGLYFIELDERADYTFHFWRAGSAATRTLLHHDIGELAEYCATAPFLLLTGVGLAVLQGRERLLELLERIAGRTRLVFDTNYRARLWESPEQFRERMEEVLPYADIILPTASDLHAAYPGAGIGELCERFLGMGAEIVAVKKGEQGCALAVAGELLEIPPAQPARVVDTTGAGDAFNAGFLAGLIRKLPPYECCRLGHRVAARAIGVRGAIDPAFSAESIDW